MSESDKDFLWGLILGVGVMIFIWVIAATLVELSKVEGGYLTYENKTYTVTLYDELRIPGEEAD